MCLACLLFAVCVNVFPFILLFFGLRYKPLQLEIEFIQKSLQYEDINECICSLLDHNADLSPDKKYLITKTSVITDPPEEEEETVEEQEGGIAAFLSSMTGGAFD